MLFFRNEIAKNVELNLVQKESYWARGPPPRPKTQDQAQAQAHAEPSQAGQTAAAARA